MYGGNRCHRASKSQSTGFLEFTAQRFYRSKENQPAVKHTVQQALGDIRHSSGVNKRAVDDSGWYGGSDGTGPIAKSTKKRTPNSAELRITYSYMV